MVLHDNNCWIVSMGAMRNDVLPALMKLALEMPEGELGNTVGACLHDAVLELGQALDRTIDATRRALVVRSQVRELLGLEETNDGQ